MPKSASLRCQRAFLLSVNVHGNIPKRKIPKTIPPDTARISEIRTSPGEISLFFDIVFLLQLAGGDDEL